MFFICDLLIFMLSQFDDVVEVIHRIFHIIVEQIRVLDNFDGRKAHKLPDQVFMLSVRLICSDLTINDIVVAVVIFILKKTFTFRLFDQCTRQKQPFFLCGDTSSDNRFCFAHTRHSAYTDQTVLFFQKYLSEEIYEYTYFITCESVSFLIFIPLDEPSVPHCKTVSDLRCADFDDIDVLNILADVYKTSELIDIISTYNETAACFFHAVDRVYTDAEVAEE